MAGLSGGGCSGVAVAGARSWFNSGGRLDLSSWGAVTRCTRPMVTGAASATTERSGGSSTMLANEKDGEALEGVRQ